MIFICVITNAYACAVIATASRLWITGYAEGLYRALQLAAATRRPEPPHHPISPPIYVSYALPRPVVRWPSGN